MPTSLFSADFEIGYGENEREGLVSAMDESLGRPFFLPAGAGNPFGQDVLIALSSPIGDAPMTRRDRNSPRGHRGDLEDIAGQDASG